MLAPTTPTLASPTGELSELRDYLRRRRYAKGEVIVLQGEPDTNLYLIESGQVTLTVSSPEGRDLTLARLGPADIFGALSLLDGGPCPAPP